MRKPSMLSVQRSVRGRGVRADAAHCRGWEGFESHFVWSFDTASMANRGSRRCRAVSWTTHR